MSLERGSIHTRVSLIIAPVLLLSATSAAQTRGMVVSNDHRVTIFNADSNTVIRTLTLPGIGLASGDCSISADGTRGFVTDGTGRVHVINLLTNTLAGPPNPIPIANFGEDTSITPDGRFMVVCDGSAVQPVAVVDVAAQRQISTFSLGFGADCNSVEVCDDRSVLVTSFNAGQLRRLVIDSAGRLLDTGERLSVFAPNNVACAPGADSGIVLSNLTGQLRSFEIPGLTPVDTRAVSSRYGNSVVISGNRAYTRSLGTFGSFPTLQGWAYDPVTGDLGVAPTFTTRVASTFNFFGMDQLAVHPDTGNVYVPQPFALRRYNRTTGALLGTMALPSAAPTGICFQPDSAPPASTCVTIQRGVFGAVRDSVLAPENNGWPAGAYPYLWTAASPRIHRTLLGFDTGVIPPGAVVTSATVSLVESWNRNFNPIRVHEVLNPWNEATVTWTSFGSLANFSPAVIASFAGGGGGTKTFDITPLAAAWIDGTSDNNGILLEEDLLPGGSLHSFAASEWTVPASRPSLEICYDF